MALALSSFASASSTGRCRHRLLPLAVGVAVITYGLGTLPWISMVMAVSWGGYSLVRKVAHVTPLVGVTIETAST